MPVPPMTLTGNNFNTVFADGTVHKGLDITPTKGNDAVVSPVRGKVLASQADGPGNTAGTSGFGPYFVRIQSADDASIHTLAHLDPNSPSLPLVGLEVDEGEQVGLIARNVTPGKFHSGVPHVHWEVAVAPSFTRVDPTAWLKSGGGKVPASSGVAWWVWVLVGWAIVQRHGKSR
jgi:murein DD-endopeptidase MepM/ murein hydrolase activator NlpD